MAHGREIKVNDNAKSKTVLGRKFYLQTVVSFLTLLLIFTHQDAHGHSLIDKHLVEGVYYLVVENDLNQAEQEFQAILAVDKNHAEAYYFLGRIYYEKVLNSSASKSMLREAEKYLRMAHSLGIVYDKLHPNLLGYNGNHRSSNNFISTLEGFSPEIVAEATLGTKWKGTGVSSPAGRGVRGYHADLITQQSSPSLINDNQPIQGNSNELRYLAQPETMPQASGRKAVATLFLETGGSQISDVQILSADALGLTRKRICEPDAPVVLVSGAKYRMEFGSKKRRLQFLAPLAIVGVGVALLLAR